MTFLCALSCITSLDLLKSPMILDFALLKIKISKQAKQNMVRGFSGAQSWRDHCVWVFSDPNPDYFSSISLRLLSNDIQSSQFETQILISSQLF